jgi:hypothetical protein
MPGRESQRILLFAAVAFMFAGNFAVQAGGKQVKSARGGA